MYCFRRIILDDAKNAMKKNTRLIVTLPKIVPAIISVLRHIKKVERRVYNEERPHESLGNMTAVEYLGLKESLENSNSVRH